MTFWTGSDDGRHGNWARCMCTRTGVGRKGGGGGVGWEYVVLDGLTVYIVRVVRDLQGVLFESRVCKARLI
jgi:hypothetical protein